MAGAPYVSSRSGRFAWMMQRVSAVVLIFLAFSHFGIQHFTSDAVSTALTVAHRMNNPWWQGYYVMFIVLALYHGINGVLGIIHDYAPRPLVRGIFAIVFWSLGFVFACMGIINIVSPQSVADIKMHYMQDGLPKGKSYGSPPVPIEFDEYDATREIRELQFINFYLEHHTHRNESDTVSRGEIFDGERLNGSDLEVDAKAKESGQSFDKWAMGIANGPEVEIKDRERCYIFSNSREFAIWALNLRLRNAEKRGDEATVRRLSGKIPAYTPGLF